MTAVALARFQRLPNPGAGSGQVVEVQFNPTEYTLTKGNQLAEIPIPGLDQPILQFVRGQTETLTLDLFFDSTEDGTGSTAKPVTERFAILARSMPVTRPLTYKMLVARPRPEGYPLSIFSNRVRARRA